MKNLTKKLSYAIYIVLVAVVFISCDSPTQYVQTEKDNPYYIINEVRISTNDKMAKYKYTVRDENGEVVIYLNEKYTIGDTLCVVAYCN